MRKAIFIIIAVILFSAVSAFAETDLSSLSLDELYEMRLAINNQISQKILDSYVAPEEKTIADLFPDEWLAKQIRDKLGMFSTKDVVTQDKLDTITSVRINGQTTEHIQVTSLEGIQYLRNLQRLEVWNQENITEIPEWIGDLVQLTELSIRICPVTVLPDSLCNLTNLKSLTLSDTEISSLPADIGNLSKLKELNISYTKITELPASIYSLELDTFNRSGLDLD